MNMLITAKLKKVVFVIMMLATLAAFSASAAVAPVATIGPVTVGGAYSGGSMYYQFNLTTSAPGVLVVKGKLTGTKLTASFPDLIATNAAAGVIAEKSKTLTVPATFSGNAKLQLTVTFNKKAIVVKPIAVVIGSQPPPAGSVAVNIYDVGFGNSVVLDAAVVSTSGLGTPTYAWTQVANSLGHKAPGTLSAANVVAPTLTTGAITNFINTANTSTTIYVNDIDDTGYTNALYVVPEHRFGTIGSLSLDNEQVTESTYVYRVLVSGNSITRTGTFTVACSLQTPAHPNIPVGMTAYYKSGTNSTNWSLLAKPSGSAAVLTHTNDLVAALRPDVEGVYVIRDNVTGKTITNTAASYVGWTGTLGASCDTCHGPGNSLHNADMVTPWQKTGHATMAKLGVNGVLSSHYSESCFVCHTLGYNKAPSASSNGNFYAVEKQLAWTFPSVLTNSNYAAMPQKLQNLANIQCESCHGPGSRHPGEPSVSLDVKVCAQCHQNGSNHVRPSQWEISPHAGGYDNVSLSRGTNPQCSRCHSPIGFTAVGKGTADRSLTNGVPTGTGPLSCQTCHDPHDAFGSPQDAFGLTERHQLRIYDTFLMGNPYFRSNNVYVALGESLTTADLRMTNSNVIVTNAGASAACMVCHNGRQLPMQTVIYGTNIVLSAKSPSPTTIGVSKYYQVGGPHDSTVAEVFSGVGAYDYGKIMGNSFHTYMADCQSCHMYQLRAPVNNVPQDSIAIDDVETPVTAAVYKDFSNVLGDHTFKMDYVYAGSNGAQHVADNIAACNQCHASFFDRVDSFDFKAANARDYDGNGVVEGIQTEVHGLLNNLGYLLKTTGLTVTTNNVGQITNISGTYYATNSVFEAQRKAAWNWFTCYREGSFGVHNTQFSIRLLQSSYTDLSTNFYNDVTRTYQQAYPNAYLR